MSSQADVDTAAGSSLLTSTSTSTPAKGGQVGSAPSSVSAEANGLVARSQSHAAVSADVASSGASFGSSALNGEGVPPSTTSSLPPLGNQRHRPHGSAAPAGADGAVGGGGNSLAASVVPSFPLASRQVHPASTSGAAVASSADGTMPQYTTHIADSSQYGQQQHQRQPSKPMTPMRLRMRNAGGGGGGGGGSGQKPPTPAASPRHSHQHRPPVERLSLPPHVLAEYDKIYQTSGPQQAQKFINEQKLLAYQQRVKQRQMQEHQQQLQRQHQQQQYVRTPSHSSKSRAQTRAADLNRGFFTPPAQSSMTAPSSSVSALMGGAAMSYPAAGTVGSVPPNSSAATMPGAAGMSSSAAAAAYGTQTAAMAGLAQQGAMMNPYLSQQYHAALLQQSMQMQHFGQYPGSTSYGHMHPQGPILAPLSQLQAPTQAHAAQLMYQQQMLSQHQKARRPAKPKRRRKSLTSSNSAAATPAKRKRTSPAAAAAPSAAASQLREPHSSDFAAAGGAVGASHSVSPVSSDDELVLSGRRRAGRARNRFCRRCEESFPSKAELELHKELVHDIPRRRRSTSTTPSQKATLSTPMDGSSPPTSTNVGVVGKNFDVRQARASLFGSSMPNSTSSKSAQGAYIQAPGQHTPSSTPSTAKRKKRSRPPKKQSMYSKLSNRYYSKKSFEVPDNSIEYLPPPRTKSGDADFDIDEFDDRDIDDIDDDEIDALLADDDDFPLARSRSISTRRSSGSGVGGSGGGGSGNSQRARAPSRDFEDFEFDEDAPLRVRKKPRTGSKTPTSSVRRSRKDSSASSTSNAQQPKGFPPNRHRKRNSSGKFTARDSSNNKTNSLHRGSVDRSAPGTPRTPALGSNTPRRGSTPKFSPALKPMSLGSAASQRKTPQNQQQQQQQQVHQQRQRYKPIDLSELQLFRPELVKNLVEKVHPCLFCSRRFQVQTSVTRHMRTHHTEEYEKIKAEEKAELALARQKSIDPPSYLRSTGGPRIQFLNQKDEFLNGCRIPPGPQDGDLERLHIAAYFDSDDEWDADSEWLKVRMQHRQHYRNKRKTLKIQQAKKRKSKQAASSSSGGVGGGADAKASRKKAARASTVGSDDDSYESDDALEDVVAAAATPKAPKSEEKGDKAAASEESGSGVNASASTPAASDSGAGGSTPSAGKADEKEKDAKDQNDTNTDENGKDGDKSKENAKGNGREAGDTPSTPSVEKAKASSCRLGGLPKVDDDSEDEAAVGGEGGGGADGSLSDPDFVDESASATAKSSSSSAADEKKKKKEAAAAAKANAALLKELSMNIDRSLVVDHSSDRSRRYYYAMHGISMVGTDDRSGGNTDNGEDGGSGGRANSSSGGTKKDASAASASSVGDSATSGDSTSESPPSTEAGAAADVHQTASLRPSRMFARALISKLKDTFLSRVASVPLPVQSSYHTMGPLEELFRTSNDNDHELATNTDGKDILESDQNGTHAKFSRYDHRGFRGHTLGGPGRRGRPGRLYRPGRFHAESDSVASHVAASAVASATASTSSSNNGSSTASSTRKSSSRNRRGSRSGGSRSSRTRHASSTGGGTSSSSTAAATSAAATSDRRRGRGRGGNNSAARRRRSRVSESDGSDDSDSDFSSSSDSDPDRAMFTDDDMDDDDRLLERRF